MAMTDSIPRYQDIRDAVRDLCAQFPNEYFRKVDEARAYLAHEVLGPRLRECARLVVAIQGRTAEEIFGWPDDMKLRSSMTLFARAADDNGDFVAVLDTFYGGAEDPATLALLF